MKPASPEQWMTVGEVAEELRIRRQQVYKLIRTSELPAHYITERTIRVRRDELYTWLETRKTSEGG
jgi:excisionase family DNA binding protein